MPRQQALQGLRRPFNPPLALSRGWNAAVELQGQAPHGWTFTRASTGTYFGDTGLIAVAGNNAPRYQLDLVSGRRGLLVEDARTNESLGAMWQDGGVGMPPLGWAAPLGTLFAPVASLYGNADSAVAFAFASVASQDYFEQTIALIDNTTYCLSVWVEVVSGTIANEEVLDLPGLPLGASITGYFRNGVPVAGNAQVQTGWLHLVVGGTYLGVESLLLVGSGCRTPVTCTLRLSRPQFEAAILPSSFIPTFSEGPDSRAADFMSIVPALALVSANGTMFVEYSLLGGDSTLGSGARTALALSDGTANEQHHVSNTGGAVGVNTVDGGVAQVAIAFAGTIATHTPVRVAYGFILNNCRAAKNNVLAAADVVATMPAIDRILVGARSGASSALSGLIHRVGVSRIRFADASIQRLTA